METITVRQSCSADIEQIRQIYAEPSNYAATLQLPFPSAEQWDKRLSSLADGSFSLVACRGDEVVGQLTVHIRDNPRRRHVATIGMGVKTSARRQGIGSTLVAAAIELTEKWHAIRRIELEVYTDNSAAIALYRKFGFEIEGTMKDYAFRDGKCVDVYAMARIAA